MKLIEIISVDLDINDQLWSDILHLLDTKQKWDYSETVHQQIIDFKKTYDTVRRGILCNIFIQFSVTMKLIQLF